MRKIHLRALVGLVALCLAAGGYYAWAQVTSIGGPLFGNEALEVAQSGPGGQSYFVTSGRMSSGYSYAYFSAFPSSFTIGQNAGTVVTSGMANGGVLLINAANTAQTFTLPPNPVIDGTIIGICNATASAWATNAVTVAANSNQTLVGSGTLTTLAASTCARYLWNQGVATWFRVQ